MKFYRKMNEKSDLDEWREILVSQLWRNIRKNSFEEIVNQKKIIEKEF